MSVVLESRVVAIVGPTAVGKSALALALASRHRAAIVSADSRQVYRYMNIGTAKPTREEQAMVEHYMLDLVSPDESFSAHRFRQEGDRVLRRLAAAGRTCFVVGGTGFYIRALLDNAAMPHVPPDQHLRRKLREEAEKKGAAHLHERLRQLDPASARRIHASNLPRLLRALEVIEKTGEPVPSSAPGPSIPALYLGLGMERDELKSQADRRIFHQVSQGLVEETRLLLSMGYDANSPALQGFGYRHMVDYLFARSTLDEAVLGYQRATHQYIRRQMTWFRSDPRIQWIAAGPSALREADERIEDWLSTASGRYRYEL